MLWLFYSVQVQLEIAFSCPNTLGFTNIFDVMVVFLCFFMIFSDIWSPLGWSVCWLALVFGVVVGLVGWVGLLAWVFGLVCWLG